MVSSETPDGVHSSIEEVVSSETLAITHVPSSETGDRVDGSIHDVVTDEISSITQVVSSETPDGVHSSIEDFDSTEVPRHSNSHISLTCSESLETSETDGSEHFHNGTDANKSKEEECDDTDSTEDDVHSESSSEDSEFTCSHSDTTEDTNEVSSIECARSDGNQEIRTCIPKDLKSNFAENLNQLESEQYDRTNVEEDQSDSSFITVGEEEYHIQDSSKTESMTEEVSEISADASGRLDDVSFYYFFQYVKLGNYLVQNLKTHEYLSLNSM